MNLIKTRLHRVHVQVLEHFAEARVVRLVFEFHHLNFLAEVQEIFARLHLAHAPQRKTLLISLNKFHALILVYFYVGWYVQHRQIIAIQHVHHNIA